MQWACELRDQLFLEYRSMVREWVAAINELGKGTHDPYLMGRIEDSRFRALTSKAAYNNHVAKHGCGSYSDSDSDSDSDGPAILSRVASGR